ncbi:hypothetical protein OIU76_025870 [Salix suchowensis]|nr:hypothetical protein OIU76_025870 [Salix suchowensis]
MPAKFHEVDVGTTMMSDINAGEKMEEPRKSDFSDPENEHLFPMSPTIGALMARKLQRSFSKSSRNPEPRVVEPLLAGKLENKAPNNVIHSWKEGGDTSVPEFRRSRSSPRGKLTILP